MEFTCRCGSVFIKGKCPDCGSTRPDSVDGMSATEFEAHEIWNEEQEKEEDDE